ncbi:hypothetical protein H8356DRAFT_1347287 [Neocallimastix lanati (nom. inval.)]|nr:hypothetical protein H8356DRAFT_1347287 [Neocallimastix sp. JGI-2020a]
MGITTITIAHRLSTIKDYDCIIAMSDGQIKEIDKNVNKHLEGDFGGKGEEIISQIE